MAETRVKLALKLVEVMQAVKRIPKNGWNDFHKYHYALEADILEALRDELAQRHVLLVPSVTGRSREPVGEKNQVVTHLEMEFTFMDADSGETISRPWLGAGADKEDKGAYKAMTGGEKYFLLKTFLIPTGDDPEGDGEQPTRKATASTNTLTLKPTAPPTPKIAPLISNKQRLELIETAHHYGWKDHEIKKTLVRIVGVDSTKLIPVARLSELMETFKSGGDTTNA